MGVFDLIKKEFLLAKGKEKIPLLYSHFSFIVRNKEIQEFLAKDEYERVRIFIFLNTVDQKILALGKDDISVEVRTIVAEKARNTAVLDFMANDPSLAVKRIVAKSVYISNDTALKLARDPAISVKVEIIENKKQFILNNEIFYSLVDGNSSFLLLKILEKDILLGEQICYILDRCKERSVLFKILAHKSTPRDVLERFFDSNPEDVMNNRSLNPFTKIFLRTIVLAKQDGSKVTYSDLLKN